MADPHHTPRSTGLKKLVEINQDLILGIAIAVFGLILIFWIIPTQVNDKGSFGLPPSLAPRALAWLMVAMGTVLTLQNLKQQTTGSQRGINRHDVAYLIASVVAVSAMLLLMKCVGGWTDRPYTGFLVGAPIGLILLTALHTGAPLWVYLFNAVAAPAVIYVGFWWGLNLPLP